MTSILILNGPNLNLLGNREPEIYGTQSLESIEEMCRLHVGELGLDIEFVQSNHEGELVQLVQSAREKHLGIILNAAAYSHTSLALADAVNSAGVPVVEVHLSNVYKREPFRHQSYITPVVAGSICGLGPMGYVLALDGLISLINPD